MVDVEWCNWRWNGWFSKYCSITHYMDTTTTTTREVVFILFVIAYVTHATVYL